MRPSNEFYKYMSIRVVHFAKLENWVPRIAVFWALEAISTLVFSGTLALTCLVMTLFLNFEDVFRYVVSGRCLWTLFREKVSTISVPKVQFSHFRYSFRAT